MSVHTARISWQGNADSFKKGRYPREHTWTFDGGVSVTGSSSPHVVPVPYSNPAAVDPEEAFVASLSSCHMLTFLWLAYRAGFVVESYVDDAVGKTAKNERGVEWVSEVVLKPTIQYAGAAPSREQEADLHRRSHAECFISNSVKTGVRVEGFD